MMVTVGSGNPSNRPARRLRFDSSPSKEELRVAARLDATGHSGRRAVVVGILAVAVLAGGLALAFREWRDRYLERAAFGAGQVATAIDPLATVVPPGVSREAWHQTVAEAHAMLVTLTASNMLDLSTMRSLRADLTERVARARPATARAKLASLWTEIARRAGPDLARRHPRPALLDLK
jgi:hypothetical protein